MLLRLTGALLSAFALTVGGAFADDTERPVLTIYTYDAFVADWGPGPTIQKAFEARCACAIRWVAVDSSIGLLSRLALEGSSSGADVVLGLDTNVMQTARETGLFAPHGVTPPPLELPAPWTDEVFLPFDYGHYAFVYDSERLPAPPASLRELVAAGPDGPTVVIQDPRTATPGLGLLLWMRHVFGDGAAAAWESLAPRVVTVTASWGEAYGLFLKGEADMALSYATSPAYHRAAEGTDKYRAAMFAEGHLAQVEVAARLKGAKQPELARDFLAFMLSPAFQRAVPAAHWMHPVMPLPEGLPTAYEGLPAPDRAILPDPAEVAARRGAYVREWLAAMGGRAAR